MTIFSKLLAAQTQSVDNTTPNLTLADPLAGVTGDAAFAAQRAQRNLDIGLESLNLVDEPVKPGHDDLTVGKSDTDVELPTGDFKAEDEGDGDGEFPGDDIEPLDDMDVIEQLDQEIEMLVGSTMAIEAYGINPTAMAILQSTNLLNGTSIQTLGLESFGFEAPDGSHSQLAIESLGEKIKEKAKEWSAKALNFVKGTTGKIMDTLTPLWDNVTGLVKSLTSKAWDATKAVGATIKAHPVATVLSIVAAIAAVGGVIAFCATGAPGPDAKMSAFKTFFDKIMAMVSKIKSPMGDVKATVPENSTKLLFTVSKSTALSTQVETIEKMGWTQRAVNAMLSQLNRAWAGIKDGVTAVASKAGKWAMSGASAFMDFAVNPAIAAGNAAGGSVANAMYDRGFGKTASAIGGLTARNMTSRAYFAFMVSLIGALFTLVVSIVKRGLQAIKTTLSALKAKVTGGEPAAATA